MHNTNTQRIALLIPPLPALVLACHIEIKPKAFLLSLFHQQKIETLQNLQTRHKKFFHKYETRAMIEWAWLNILNMFVITHHMTNTTTAVCFPIGNPLENITERRIRCWKKILQNHKKAGSGFWSPSWPDIWIFWIWIGLDIISLSTGSGSSKWNTMWPCKTCWYGMIVVWEKITMFRNHITESLAYLSSFSRLIAMFPATRDTNFQTVDISSNMQLGTVWRWAWLIL